MILIKNGCVYTMAGKIYERGYVLADAGKIVETGDMRKLDESLVYGTVYDAGGGFIMPGIVDGHCHIGMWEDSICAEGDDGNEDSEPVTPQLRAIDAVNPRDKTFKEALEAGVTTVVTGPGSANVIGGQFAALKTFGSCVDDMIIKAPAAVKAALGENPKTVHGGKDRQPQTRMATAALLRETLKKAEIYLEDMLRHSSDPENYDKPDYDFKLEALIPVLKKEIPLKVHAHRADDMFTAVRIAKEFDINITIEHATEAHLVADKLAELKIPLIIGPNLGDRSKPELSNLCTEAAGILEKAGLEPAIMTDHPELPCKYITLSAAMAVRDGMSKLAALRAITILPAKYCGIDDRVGSLEPGKDADIAVFNMHPFDYMAKTKYVFSDGKCVFNSNDV